MMIGTNTEFKMPFIFDLKTGGPNGYVTATDDSMGASKLMFPDWTNWDKKPVSMQVEIGSVAASSAVQASTAPANIFTTSLVSNNITMNIPVITLFNINNLKSPTAVYNNENLNICGGIPIAIKASRSGTATIEIKCTKHYDTSAKGIPSDTDAKIKFKKSTFTDNRDNYFSGTYGSETTTTKFDGSKTISISNQKFKFSVQKGEDVWMNIDPITLGQHIRISDLRCTLEYE